MSPLLTVNFFFYTGSQRCCCCTANIRHIRRGHINTPEKRGLPVHTRCAGPPGNATTEIWDALDVVKSLTPSSSRAKPEDASARIPGLGEDVKARHLQTSKQRQKTWWWWWWWCDGAHNSRHYDVDNTLSARGCARPYVQG